MKKEIAKLLAGSVETYHFPKEAIREAVFNAIAHKFYGALIPIQISVYVIGFILRMIVFSQKIGQSMI